MAIHFYHPNKAIKGFAASFWYSERDNTVFATILKQSGWDDKTENGIFKGSVDNPEGKVNVKFSDCEVAGIIDCIERNRPFNGFHDSEETPKNIAFTPWLDKNNNNTQKGFSFSITVTDKQDSSYKNSFYIGLTFAEARLIREFLIHSLHTYFGRLKANTQPAKNSSPAIPTQSTSPEVKSLVNF